MKTVYLIILLLFNFTSTEAPAEMRCLDGSTVEYTFADGTAAQWGGCGNFLLATNILGTCSVHMQMSQDPGSEFNIHIWPYMNGFCPGGSVGDNGSSANCLTGITNKIQYFASVVTYISFGGNPIPMQYINESGYTDSPYCCFE